jgi:glutamate dehydrogenase/leucine dehydrogenase
LGSHRSHGLRVTIKAELLDLRYAGGTIGFEYQPKQLGDEVIEFLAGAWIREFATVGTTL